MVFTKILHHIKRSFGPDQKGISRAEMGPWFNQASQPLIDSAQKSFSELLKKIQEEKDKLPESIRALESSSIQDKDKVDNKVKNVVLGHRKNYINQLQLFSSGLAIPVESDPDSVLSFHTELMKKLDTFGESTKKSYYASQHLFYEPVETLGTIIRTISSHVSAIKRVSEEQHLELINTTKELIKELESLERTKKNLLEGIDAQKGEKEEREALCGVLASEILVIKQSGEYVELQDLLKRKEEALKEMENIRSVVLHLFAPLERPLRKFSKITVFEQKMLELYTEDVVAAFFSDKSLTILSILDNLKKNIEGGSVELKQKDKEKTIKRIEMITKDVLEGNKIMYATYQFNVQEIEKEIEESDIMQIVEDKEKELAGLKMQVEVLQGHITELEKRLDVDVDSLVDQIKQNILTILNVEIQVVN